MPSLALTDRNNLYGAIEFYKTCTKERIKPIIGVDLTVSMPSSFVQVIFLAENYDGYKNLLKLVSKAHLESDALPAAKKEHLESYGKGLIALIPDESLRAVGEPLVEMLRAALGRDNVFARLGWNGGKEEQIKSAGLARALGLTLVASDDTYYLKPEDREVRDIVRKIADPSLEPDTRDLAFISPDTLAERYRAFPDALQTAIAISDRVDLKLELGSWVFPKFPINQGTTYEVELDRLARAGLLKRNLKGEAVEKRLAYELSVINGKGFAPYFLTVADLLAYARSHGVLTTTRGSAAGSLVSYLTGITNINPLEYELPFERFLNPERPKAPDIDMDFADVSRDKMIAYAKERYGDDAVAQIGTFGTMAARASVRDVARALGYPYGVGDRIAKLIPLGSQGFPMTIDRALDIEEELKKLYQSDEDAETILNAAKRIEGNARHISIHAAGIVIAPSAVTDFVSVERDPRGGAIITQFDMHAVEDAGLLKFDFLGLKNLSVLGDAVERVQKRLGTHIDIESVPLEDPAVFDMLSRGETEGVFQLGGSGMTRYLKELKPTSIHDINAMVALYRPGPMEMIPAYIARKNNPALITHIDPRMESILKRSYGIITYQDDVLLTAVEIAGYSWLEADALRKAMGKKIPAEMEAQKEKFIEGAVTKGKLTKGKAEAIWRLIEPFAAYGFNKAHAASYGRVAFETAYMKAHYPSDYMAAVMTADSGDTERIAEHVTECERMNIRVLPPDVNESMETFTVIAEGMIRFGLGSIKNFGDGAARAVIEERAKEKFASIGDFLRRVPGSLVNRRALEALIKCGAFDQFAKRGVLLGNMDTLLAYSKDALEPKNQASLFGALPQPSGEIRLESYPELPQADMLAAEKELLGIYVSGHPLDRFRAQLEPHKGSVRRARGEDREGYPLVVAGVVETIKPILTKKGDRMAFIKISDKEASLEGVLFPEAFKAGRDAIFEGSCILVKGKLSKRNGEPSIIIDKIKSLTSV